MSQRAERRPSRSASHPIARLAGTVVRLPRYLNLAQGLFRDGSISPGGKAALGLGIAYTISPVDLIPGIIPVAGQLDDLAALLLGLKRALASVPPEVASAHMARVGLSESALDADLRVVQVAGLWLASRIVNLGVRALTLPIRLALGRLSASRPRSTRT